MELIDTFTGRWHQTLRAPVQMRLYRNTLNQYTLIIECAYKQEIYDRLRECDALTKWFANKKWWS